VYKDILDEKQELIALIRHIVSGNMVKFKIVF